jgi:hypothetical protein
VDRKGGVTLDETGVIPMMEMIAPRKGRTEAMGDGVRPVRVMKRDGSDPLGDDKMSGLRMMELMMSDIEAQREVEIGGVIRPEGTGTEGENAPVIGDTRGRVDDRWGNSVNVMNRPTQTSMREKLVIKNSRLGSTDDRRSYARSKLHGELTRH